MNRAWNAASAIGLGAGIMYLLDPQGGKRRRAWIGGKARFVSRKSGDAVRKVSRDVRNRVHGLTTEVQSRLHGPEHVDDDVLIERVRSRLGRLVSHPSAIHVSATLGRVQLRGPVLEREFSRILKGVRSVRGVQDVDNHLDTYKEPADIPGLQGGLDRPRSRFAFLRENWPPATRVLAGTAGSGLAVYGAIRRGPVGIALTGLGAALLARGITNGRSRPAEPSLVYP